MGELTLESPYPAGDGYRWLRGNLHTHTTRSDGDADIQTVINRYAALGHDFLQISDHDRPADYTGLDPAGLVLLAGSEVTAGGPHVLCVGSAARIEPGERQRAVDAVSAAGGLAVLCHPDWEHAFDHVPIRQLKLLKNYCGIEIYNGGVHWGAGSGYALDKWDMLLSGGRTVWGFANDDAHHDPEIGRGWNVVRVRERTAAAVLDALRRGAFYASTGVTIESIETEGTRLTVVAPDAEAIALHGEHGNRYAFVEATRLTFDAANIASPYLRVDCFGRGERRAWSQPILRAGPDAERIRELLRAKPVFRVLRADRAPALTGRIDDPLWSSAPAHTQFHRHPAATAPPVATDIRAILAGESLYFAARCEEPKLESLRTVATTEQGNIWADDAIELYFDVEDRAEAYYSAQINAAGQGIIAHRAGGQPVKLVARTGRTATGWTLEVVVPLAAMGLAAPAAGSSFGFNMHRNRAVDRSNFSWSWGGASYHAPEHFGRMLF